jgi:hypothetical protein
LSNKADKTSVYTKKETEDKINELISNSQHLIRKIFDSKEEAEAFITGINNPTDYVYLIKNNSATADKYAEYLYIDGSLELVGSWDVNLDDYVTEKDFETLLNGKVDVETGKTLISVEDIEKLAGISAGAEKNFISAVNNAEFNVFEGKLELKSVPVSKVDNLENLLNGKADASVITELEDAISTNSGNIVNLAARTTKVEEDIITLTDSVSDLTDLLNSYLTKEEFDEEMTLVKDDLTEVKEAITWGTIN